MRRSEPDFRKEKIPLLESFLGSINELLSSRSSMCHPQLGRPPQPSLTG